jgi:hypothetical protein
LAFRPRARSGDRSRGDGNCCRTKTGNGGRGPSCATACTIECKARPCRHLDARRIPTPRLVTSLRRDRNRRRTARRSDSTHTAPSRWRHPRRISHQVPLSRKALGGSSPLARIRRRGASVGPGFGRRNSSPSPPVTALSRADCEHLELIHVQTEPCADRGGSRADLDQVRPVDVKAGTKSTTMSANRCSRSSATRFNMMHLRRFPRACQGRPQCSGHASGAFTGPSPRKHPSAASAA